MDFIHRLNDIFGSVPLYTLERGVWAVFYRKLVGRLFRVRGVRSNSALRGQRALGWKEIATLVIGLGDYFGWPYITSVRFIRWRPAAKAALTVASSIFVVSTI